LPDIAAFLHKVSIYAIPVILAITFHEAAHGYVAFKKGDPTAMMLGRVTLNPIHHIDPVGTILLPLAMLLLGTGFVFGWARPVPVNFRLLHDQKRDPIYVSAAGVVTNLAMAALSGILFRILIAFDPGLLYEAMMQGSAGLSQTTARVVTIPLALMCVVSVQFNTLLAVFNMIPVPPLDGGRIAVGLLPPRASMALASVERYGMLIVLALLMFGPLGIIWQFVQLISSFILGG
jgi:Zn-dependent protease